MYNGVPCDAWRYPDTKYLRAPLDSNDDARAEALAVC